MSSRFDDIINSLGGPEEAMRAIDYKRGPSQISNPYLDSLSVPDLGALDRYTWANAVRKNEGFIPALAGVLPIAGYEALKGVAQIPKNPATAPFSDGARLILGGATLGTPDDTMKINERTSPASFRNIGSYLQGVFRKPR